MDRIEIEAKLNRERASLLEALAAMTPAELSAPRTPSEHDPATSWSYADHFIHATLVERSWNDMFRRHLSGGQGMTLGRNAEHFGPGRQREVRPAPLRAGQLRAYGSGAPSGRSGRRVR